MMAKKPSAWLYAVGIAVLFGSCAGSCGLSLLSLGSGEVESMQRFVMPGTHEVSMEAGSYYLYAETRSTVDGERFTWNGGSYRCGLMERDTQASVEFERGNFTQSYTLGSSYSGESAFAFDIASPGTYILGCDVDDGPMVMALNRGRVLGGMAHMLIGLVGYLIGGTIIGYTAWRRSRATQR